jgi:hypothetical protein
VYYIVEKHMTKAALKNFTAEIARKRREVSRLREDLRDMLDHLAVIEARAKSFGGPRYSTAEVKKVLGL